MTYHVEDYAALVHAAQALSTEIDEQRLDDGTRDSARAFLRREFENATAEMVDDDQPSDDGLPEGDEPAE